MKRPPLQRASAPTQKAAIAVVTAKVSEGPEAVSRNLLEVPRSETTNQNRERGYALSPIELRKRVMSPQLASMLRVDAREACGVP